MVSLYFYSSTILPGIVQQAQGRSVDTAVSPHHNNQSTIYAWVFLVSECEAESRFCYHGQAEPVSFSIRQMFTERHFNCYSVRYLSKSKYNGGILTILSVLLSALAMAEWNGFQVELMHWLFAATTRTQWKGRRISEMSSMQMFIWHWPRCSFTADTNLFLWNQWHKTKTLQLVIIFIYISLFTTSRNPEDGNSMFLRNAGKYLQVHIASRQRHDHSRENLNLRYGETFSKKVCLNKVRFFVPWTAAGEFEYGWIWAKSC
jgi:hypothetical protein